MTMKLFGDWLRDELAKRDMTQAELSRASGITTAGVAYLISGKRNPGQDSCVKIAHALRLPEETVFRAAGLLKPRQELDERRGRFETLLSDLSDDDVDDLYALALSKLERRQQKKLKPAG